MMKTRTLPGARGMHIPPRPMAMICCGNADGGFSETPTLPSLDDNPYPPFLKVGEEM